LFSQNGGTSPIKISPRHLFSYYTSKIITIIRLISNLQHSKLFQNSVPQLYSSVYPLHQIIGTRSVRDCFVCDSAPSLWNDINGWTTIPSWLSYFVHYSRRFIHRFQFQPSCMASDCSYYAALIRAAYRALNCYIT